MNKPDCSFKGCTLTATALGLCHSHYMQHRRGKQLTALKGPHGNSHADLEICSVWLPATLVAVLDARMKENGTTRSQVVRELLAKGLSAEVLSAAK